MANGFAYPSVEQVEEFNILTLAVIRAKKADAHNTLSGSKILEAIRECMDAKGDVHQKAAALMAALVKKHPFASGNRRTAFIAAKSFTLANGGHFRIPDEPANAKVMRGIRENFYTQEEICEWIKNGKIREFTR
ncbi:MAG: type II toxin-antitoxin system death-on-curing family toxin [Candidatus Micrarchaeia archaeon]